MSWKPGDKRETRDMMVRVDQAGEYGATRIYAGQLAIMGDRTPMARMIHGMAVQEQEHRAFFDAMLARRGIRPTALQPFWDGAGFALGALTAAMGPSAAMACTAAVETEIDKHYQQQVDELVRDDDDPELRTAVLKFQGEKLEHRDTALDHGAENAFGYPVLSGLIRMGCRVAIAVSKRI